MERVGKLRLESGTLLESRNFGPSLQVGEHNLHFVSKVRSLWGSVSFSPFSPTASPSILISFCLYLQIQFFSGPNFLGDHISFEDDQTSLPASFQPQSCRVHGGR